MRDENYEMKCRCVGDDSEMRCNWASQIFSRLPINIRSALRLLYFLLEKL